MPAHRRNSRRRSFRYQYYDGPGNPENIIDRPEILREMIVWTSNPILQIFCAYLLVALAILRLAAID